MVQPALSKLAPCDVVLSSKGAGVAGLEIGTHLATKGFCVVDAGLPAETFEMASAEAEELTNSSRFSVPAPVIADGLLGSEGSSQILHVESVAPAEHPNLMRVDAAFGELASLIGQTLPSLGCRCPQRSGSVLCETGLAEDAPAELEDEEAERWLPLFSRGKIMMVASLGPIKGILELDPFEEETDPFEVETVPGSIVLLRADLMSHRHFAHSRAFTLSSFLLDDKPSGRREEALMDASLTPAARALQTWLEERLKEVKEEEAESGKRLALPAGWRSAMDRLYHTEQRVAVRGLAGRWCSSYDPAAWHCMQMFGTDLVTNIPLQRWDNAQYYDPHPESWRLTKTCLNHSSFAEGLELFDCKFFTLSPVESRGMDPHQRQVLEVGYEAAHGAGYKKGKLMNSNGGVYLGSSSTIFGSISEAGATGGAASINSNRFSYCLGMKGPSMTIDTEAASSLSAVFIGCDGVLEKGRGVINQFSLSGGVHFVLGPVWFPQMQAAGLLSATGRCLTWDDTADGHCFGDNVGFVCLRRLTENIDGQEEYIQGQNLEGIIAASALNSTGRSAAMNAPSGASDQELLSQALRNASISPASIDSVECDGRGGCMADAVEVDSIERAFRSEAEAEEATSLLLSAVKSRMGNGLEGAGISALIRAILSTKEGFVSANCHLNQLNPYVEFDTPLNFLTEVGAYPHESMYCGVSAKGFGGTNAHVICFGQLESSPAAELQTTQKLLDFWPGGGGDLEDEKAAFRGYSIAGTFSGWKLQAMELEGDGSYAFTLIMGENRWEDFQIFVDGDMRKCLHPDYPQAARGTTVQGPDAGLKGLCWRISGRRCTQSPATEEETGLLSLTNGTGTGRAIIPLALQSLGSSRQEDWSECQAGTSFRVIFKIAGKFRMVTWQKMAGAPEPSKVLASTYSITSDWNGWGFSPMLQEGDLWSCEATLLHQGGDFQIVRNEDWGQVIGPRQPHAEPDQPGIGPDNFAALKGLSWCLNGAPGDVFRIELRREVETCSWAVSWKWLRKESFSDQQLVISKRPRIGICGSWTGFCRQRELTFEKQDGDKSWYSCILTLGMDGFEGFQLLWDLNWERLIHPDRYVSCSGAPHRVMESYNDGMAMDLVWTVADGVDQASSGDHFRISVAASSHKVLQVSWTRATGPDLDTAVREGQILQ